MEAWSARPSRYTSSTKTSNWRGVCKAHRGAALNVFWYPLRCFLGLDYRITILKLRFVLAGKLLGKLYKHLCFSLNLFLLPYYLQVLRSTAAPLRASISFAPAASSQCQTDEPSWTASRLHLNNASVPCCWCIMPVVFAFIDSITPSLQ